MSETTFLLSGNHLAPAIPAPKTDELLRPVGTGHNPVQSDISLKLGNTQTTILPEVSSSRIEGQLAAYQAQDQHTQILADRLSGTDPQKNEAKTTSDTINQSSTPISGQAAQQIANQLTSNLPSPVDTVTGLPKIQFLSHDTALKTAPKPVNEEAKTSTSDNRVATLRTASLNNSPITRDGYVGNFDVPAYSWSVNNGYGGTDTVSFNDHFNQILPGVAVNTSFDDIGERRDGAWKQPGMHAYPSSDSGYRADQVQSYFLNNADTIGRNILGTPIPADRVKSLRDFIHGEIKQHHRGNQETISEVLHLLATQDSQTSTQLNKIWHAALGRAINSDELSDAISQISIGHATLQTELWTVTHSQEAANHLKEIISAVQNRTVNAGDEIWVRSQQDSMGRGEQTLAQVRQNLAHWTANNGQYDSPFKRIHLKDARPEDRDYAANMIGNGWSLKDYQRHEMTTADAHNAQKKLLQENLIREEGTSLKAYLDTQGYLTVGIGHKVLPEDNIRLGDTISSQRVEDLFNNDTNKYLDMARGQVASAEIYSSEFVAALADADYQEGDFTRKNPNTWAQIKSGQYNEAADSLNQGPWMQESPNRVRALQAAIRNLNQ